MRECSRQVPLLNAIIDHEHARELATMSQLLDELADVAELVQADLLNGVRNPKTGRRGMTGEFVLRALVVKQLNSFSYEELSFHLADSSAYRSFCRIGIADRVPTAKTLQRNIKKVRSETLEKLNRSLVGLTQKRGIEDGGKMRGDCTVTESNIHAPTDSALLDDCVRVLTRLLHRTMKEVVHVGFTDHTRRARRRAIAIQYARRKLKRVPLYRDLIKVTERTVRGAERALAKLESYQSSDVMAAARAAGLAAELRHYPRPSRRALRKPVSATATSCPANPRDTSSPRIEVAATASKSACGATMHRFDMGTS